MFSPKSSPNIHLSSYLNIFNLLYICVYVNRDRAPSVSVVFMCALRMRGSERRKGTPLRKRTNKDTFRCLITIWSTGIARRGLNELIFVNRFLVASWKRCHSSSGFSLSQFVLFLHVIPDRLDDDQIRSLCGALAVVRLLVQTKISLDYYN